MADLIAERMRLEEIRDRLDQIGETGRNAFQQLLSGATSLGGALGMVGPVTYLCRPQCSFRPLGVRRPRGFCLPMLNADGGGYRSR